MSDKAVFVRGALLCLQPLPGKPLFLPLQKRLLLAENEFAFSRSPSDLAENIFCLLSEIIHSRRTLLLLLTLCRSLPEVKFGPQKRACAVTFVYVVAVETVYKTRFTRKYNFSLSTSKFHVCYLMLLAISE